MNTRIYKNLFGQNPEKAVSYLWETSQYLVGIEQGQLYRVWRDGRRELVRLVDGKLVSMEIEDGQSKSNS